MAQTYDDQEKGGGGENVEDLRRRMGIHLTDEERAQAGDGSLGKQEEQASQDKADDQGEGRKKLTPEDLADAESKGSPFGLYVPGKQPDNKLWSRFKNFNRRKKAFSALGIGGILGIFLTIITLFPTYRLPSLMSAFSALAGHAVEEIVENRASRLVIGYLIHRADVDAVAGDSLGSTLYRTWRAHKLEAKILRETGFEWKKVNGEVRMFQDGKDLGRVQTYEDVIRITEGNPWAQKKFKKVLKIASGKRWLLSSRLAQDALKRRFPSLRFSAPEEDPSKPKAENIANFRTKMFETIGGEKMKIFDQALGCITNDNCDFFDKEGNPAERPSEELPDSKKEALNQFSENLDANNTETKEEIKTGTMSGKYKTTVDLADIAQKKLTSKILGLAAGGIPGLIMTAATLYHYSYVIQTNNLAQAIPAYAVAYTTGIFSAFYSGQASNILAGRTAAMFIEEMNNTTAGVEKGVGYKLVYGKDTTGAEPIEAMVNNDKTMPMSETTNTIMTIQYWTVGLPLVAVYYLDWAIGEIIGFFTGPLFEWALKAVFGDDYMEKLMAFLSDLVMPLFAGHVDEFATAAKWGNQIITGWSANWMWYCETYMGCKTTSEMKTTIIPNFIHTGGLTHPVNETMAIDTSGGGGGGMAYARTYMDDLTLQERLFSIEEPYSLFNQVVRAVPSDAKAPQMVAGVFRQVGSLPATLLATLTGSAKAATPTPQQIADVTGVRQYGYGPEDLARATSPEIFAEAQPACDQDYDNEEEVNLCMADRETAKALLCSVADCQEFNNGFLEDGTSTTAGLWSNVKQQWTVKQMTAALGLW